MIQSCSINDTPSSDKKVLTKEMKTLLTKALF